MMKLSLSLTVIAIALLATGCAGPGGPATRTGRTIDHGVQKIGSGVETAGEKIQETAQ